MIFEKLSSLYERANESFLGRVALRSSGIGTTMLILEGVSYAATGNTLSLPIDAAIGTVIGNNLFIADQNNEQMTQV